MKLYLLTRTDEVYWDETAGYVIRAETEERAWEISNWSPREEVVCHEIGTACGFEADIEGEVLEDFRAG